MPQPEQNYFSRFFQSDRAMLMLCVGISLVFWTLTRLSQSFKTTQECTLIYDLPQNYILASHAPEKVLVTMEGVGWDLMSNYFQQEKGLLILNLNTNKRQIYNSAQLISKLTRNQNSIDIKGLNLDLLELLVEEKINKKIPIQLEANLVFDPRYQLKTAPLLTPDSVLLSGPASSLDSLENWPTTLLQLPELNEDQHMQLQLKEAPEKNITIDPTQINLSIIVEQLTEKNFFIPITVRNAPDSIKIFPENIKISCIVGLSHYEQVQAEDFALEVDMAGIGRKEKNNTLPVVLSKQPRTVRGVHLSYQSVEFFFVEDQVGAVDSVEVGHGGMGH